MLKKLTILQEQRRNPQIGEWIYLGNILEMHYPEYRYCIKYLKDVGRTPNGFVSLRER